METKLNIVSFYLPSIFISEKIKETLKNKNITVNNRIDHENVFLQWVIDWLRVEKKIHISIDWCKDIYVTRWFSFIDEVGPKRGKVIISDNFNSYEECQEAAILAALELV